MQNMGMEWFYCTVAGTQADVETLCDDESGVCLDGDEGVFKKNQYLIPKTCNAKLKT